MRERTIRAIGASSILGVVAVAAVFSSGPPEAPAEIRAPVVSTTTTAPATTMTTLSPFHYRVGLLAAPGTDNFWEFYGGNSTVWDAYVLGPTKPALFGLDPVTSSLTPELAEEVPEAVEGTDGWTVDIALRPDAAWSDGTPITASDYAFTFETVRALALGGGWERGFPPEVAGVAAIDDRTIRITFSSRPTLGVWPHAAGTVPVMPEHIWATPGAADADTLYGLSGQDDVGGGPLTLVRISDDRAVSTANPGHPNPGPDQVDYLVYPDLDAAVAALAEGEVDTILSPNGLSPDHLAVLEGTPGVTVSHSPANGIRFLGFNLNREPMTDPAFRQALSLLVETREHSFVNQDNIAWFDSTAYDELAPAPGDPGELLARALAALRAAGYSWVSEPTLNGTERVSGEGLRIRGLEAPILTILTPGDSYDPTRPEQAGVIASALGWLGFDARPVETDFQTVIDLAFTPDEQGSLHYDMALLGWTLGSPALPDFYQLFFSSSGQQNNTGYASDRFQAALDKYLAAVGHADARAALWEMEAILAEDLPYLVTSHTTIGEAYRSDRVAYGFDAVLGGIQGRLGGVGDVVPIRATLGG